MRNKLFACVGAAVVTVAAVGYGKVPSTNDVFRLEYFGNLQPSVTLVAYPAGFTPAVMGDGDVYVAGSGPIIVPTVQAIDTFLKDRFEVTKYRLPDSGTNLCWALTVNNGYVTLTPVSNDPNDASTESVSFAEYTTTTSVPEGS